MVALLVGLGPDLADASPIIDQQQTTFIYTSGFQFGQTDLAQTFSVGIPGRLPGLASSQPTISSPIGLNLLDTLAGIPTSVIASAVVPTVSGDPSWITSTSAQTTSKSILTRYWPSNLS